MANVVLVVVVLLAIGFVSTRLSEWVRLPHSVFLVVLGLVAGGLIRQYDAQSLTPWLHHFPDIILYVLLPPLIFESAYNLDLKALRHDAVPVMVLSIVGLVVSTFLVGWGMHGALGLALIPALIFGALISATDPVAVVALFKDVGAPKRLNLLVEGESLFNDGTAIVMFGALLGLLSISQLDAAYVVQALERFFIVFWGGLLVGLALAALLTPWVMLCRSGAAQIGLTVAGAYFSFILSDHIFHLSGVMATVGLGLFMGARARLEFNREALHGMGHMWEFLTLSANTLVFVAVGLTVNPQLLWQSLEYIPLTLLVVYGARALSLAVTVPLMNRWGWCEPISWQYQFIMFWGGLRGGLALALVLLLPDTLSLKPLFLALATAVVLTTLLVNALTIGPAMRRLGIDRLSNEEDSLFRHALANLWATVFRHLKQAARGGLLSAQVVDRFVRQTRSLTRDDHPLSADLSLRIGLRSALLAEGMFYEAQMEDGVLGKQAYLDLKLTINQRLHQLETHGPAGLAQFDGKGLNLQRPWDGWLERLNSAYFVRIQEQRLRRWLNVLFHLERGLHVVCEDIRDPAVLEHLHQTSARLYTQYTQLSKAYPHVLFQVQADFIARALSRRTHRWLDRSLKSGFITRAVHRQVAETISQQEAEAMQALDHFRHPEPAFLVAQTEAFQGLSADTIAELVRRSERHFVHEGHVLDLSDLPGIQAVIVMSGLHEHRQPNQQARRHPHWVTGDAVMPGPTAGELVTVVSGELLWVPALLAPASGTPT